MKEFFLMGEKLERPLLRFNPSSTSYQCEDARKGLKLYGPYDSNRLGKRKIVCGLLFPSKFVQEKDIFIEKLIRGEGSYVGFKMLFRVPIEIYREIPFDENEGYGGIDYSIKLLIESEKNEKLDLVIVILPSKDIEMYRYIKAKLLGNGIPSQIVTIDTIRKKENLSWILENIALQIYAKIGGTPWTVSSNFSKKELIIGISRTMDITKKYIVGFITLFTYDGDYQFMSSLSPRPISYSNIEQYRKDLAEMIISAYRDYEKRIGKPTSIIFHLCKRPGKFREIEAISQSIQQNDNNLSYALLHLNDDTNYRLFDTTHPTFIPLSGIKIDTSHNTALLFLDGRSGQAPYEVRKKRGAPRVLEVIMDKRSTLDLNEFPRLVYQVYSLAYVNWRGFNARTIPVTLNYSHLIARMVAEVGIENWNIIINEGRLRDKAWFL